jgi:hypothetical protein
MNNLPSRDQDLLLVYERLARTLEAMYLNHEQRGERIALIAQMVKAPMDWATPDFLKWLYPLYHTLLTLYTNRTSPIMTHHDIKHGLRFFAELCQAAQEDLETIARNEQLNRWQPVDERFDIPLEFERADSFGVDLEFAPVDTTVDTVQLPALPIEEVQP